MQPPQVPWPLLLAVVGLLWPHLATATNTSESTAIDYGPIEANPWRTEDCAVMSNGNKPCAQCNNFTIPNYGAPTTLRADGSKLCPFKPDSPMCENAACYFFTVDAQSTRICPHPNCDSMIPTYCCGDHGNCKAGVNRPDFGCMVMTRPPFMSAETEAGIGPYLDWLEDTQKETPEWATTQPQFDLRFVVDGTERGGMSATVLEMTVGGSFCASASLASMTAADNSTFRAGLANGLGEDVLANNLYVSALSGGKATVQALGYPTWSNPLPSTMTFTVQGTDDCTVSAISSSVAARTNDCYGTEPRSECLGEDPAKTRYSTSVQLMSGVESCAEDMQTFKPACYTNADVITMGIYAAIMLVAVIILMWLMTRCSGY